MRLWVAVAILAVFAIACGTSGGATYDSGYTASATPAAPTAPVVESSASAAATGAVGAWQEVRATEDPSVVFFRAEVTITFGAGPPLLFSIIDKRGQSVDPLVEYRAADFYLEDFYKDPTTGEQAVVLSGEQENPVNQNCHGYTLWRSLGLLGQTIGAEFWVNPTEMVKVVSDNRFFEVIPADQVQSGDVVVFGAAFDHSGIVAEVAADGNHLVKSSNGEEPVVLATVNALAAHYGSVHGYYRAISVD